MERERDAQSCAAWLRNKLAGGNAWGARTISSLLSEETLKNIQVCFKLLETNIKIKVLLAMLSMRRREVERLYEDVRGILEIASTDGDDWVRVLSEIIRDLPSHNTLNSNLESNTFVEALRHIQSQLEAPEAGAADAAAPDLRAQPLETLYLNRNLIPHRLPTERHFKLKKKPQAAQAKPASEKAIPMMGARSRAFRRSSVKAPGTGSLGFSSSARRRSQLASATSAPAAGASRGATSRRALLGQLSAPAPAGGSSGVKTLALEDVRQLGIKRDQKKRKPTEGSGKAQDSKKRKVATKGAAADGSAAADSGEAAAAAPASAAVVDSAADAAPTAAAMSPEEKARKAVNQMVTEVAYKKKGKRKRGEVEAAAAADAAAPEPDIPYSVIFSEDNRLTAETRSLITAFLQKKAVRPEGGKDVVQIVMNEERRAGPRPETVQVEQVVFELTHSTQQWRRLRRKRVAKLKHKA